MRLIEAIFIGACIYILAKEAQELIMYFVTFPFGG